MIRVQCAIHDQVVDSLPECSDCRDEYLYELYGGKHCPRCGCRLEMFVPHEFACCQNCGLDFLQLVELANKWKVIILNVKAYLESGDDSELREVLDGPEIS